MKEIGEKLKEARVSMGISIAEAAEDLKLRPSQLESIEEGNRDAFKDIFYLKYFIRDYAKYLGLDYETMVEDFNEFVFDYTSKISIEDIKKASKDNNKEKKQVKKISSPYTIDKDTGNKVPKPIIIGIIAVLVCIVIYSIVLFIDHNSNDDKNKNEIHNKDEVAYNLEV